MNNNGKLIFITLWRLNDWGKYNRRDEALLSELSRRQEVEQVLHVEHISLRGLLYKALEWMKEKDESVRKVYKSHIVKGWSPYPVPVGEEGKYSIYSVVIPYMGRNPLLKKIGDAIVRMQYRAINRHADCGGSKVILTIYLPSENLEKAVPAIKHDLLIADFEDDTAERAADPGRRKWILGNYREYLPRCNWIFSNTSWMNSKYRDLAGQEIALVPNGVDPQLFRMNGNKKVLAAKGRKVVGYVGVLNREVDMDLVRCLLSRFPGVDFVFIGATSEERSVDMRKLAEDFGNFHYLGERSYVDVPAYLAGCDVLINIKSNDNTTAGGESQKIYEYLATGKPIVSTPVPPADRFSDLVYVATDKTRFEELLCIALKEDALSIREQRVKAAEDNSWERRVDVILARVSDSLGMKDPCFYCGTEQETPP
jgi:glycosyltransferase involved in cell wall biosynthesis